MQTGAVLHEEGQTGTCSRLNKSRLRSKSDVLTFKSLVVTEWRWLRYLVEADEAFSDASIYTASFSAVAFDGSKTGESQD